MALASRKGQQPCVIPASPNWYCSGSASCNDSGYYAFAARNSVYLINLKDTFPVCRDAIHFKRDRVSSVCLLPCSNDNDGDENGCIVAVGSEENWVKIWHDGMKKILKEHKLHQGKVNVIVSHESTCITSGDDKGLMVTWNYENDNRSTWMPVLSNILSMANCPHNKWLTAVGYGNGHVIVCNVKKQEIIQHFKSHIDEVHAVVWCPTAHFHLAKAKDETKSEGYHLASGSKDKTIKVWNTVKENYLLSLTLPARTSVQKGRKKFEDLSRAKIWMALCWCKSNTLISSSLSGEMLVWDLNTRDWSCIAPAHNRIVFTISSDFKSGRLITTSMDRQIMFWNSETYEFLNSIPTLGGFVYSLTASVLDPNCIIYGVGDNLIRFWNTRSDDRPYDTNILWQGIKTKVTVVTCHKTKESVIGFGTDDGHVGVYNIRSGKFEVSASYHKKTVYSLSWGPNCENSTSAKVPEGSSLFSCGGEGAVLIHSIHDLQSKAKDMNAIIKKTNQLKDKLPSRSDIEWKADLTAVAVGNDDGSIEVFAAPNLHRICLIQVHKKIINCMKWHHEFESSHGQTVTKHSNWLASGSSDNYVCVTDLTHVLDNEDCQSKLALIKDKFRFFNSHSQRITGLSWNPHTSGILASSSFDGSVQMMLDKPVIDVLVALTKRAESPLRANGAWGLMNLSYDVDENLKTKILRELSLPHLFRLLEDPDVKVVVKVLGLIRNLLAVKEGVSSVLENGGSQLMSTMGSLMDSETVSKEVKNQAVCVLCSVSNSQTGKEVMMENDKLLSKIIQCLMDGDSRIQLASVSCILILSCSSEEGSKERQTKLRSLGAQKQLQALLTTPNVNLFDKVKVALQQFS